MSTLTIPNSFTSGTAISSTNVNANFTAVANVVNGGLDTSNLSASAGIVGTQLANGTLAVAQLGTNLQKGIIPLNLSSLREIVSDDMTNIAANGGLLASDTTPTYTRVSTTSDRRAYVTWAAANVDAVQFEPAIKPVDFDDTVACTVHLWCSKNANANTVTMTVWASDSTDPTDDIGGPTSTIVQAEAEYTVTLSANDILPAPGWFTVSLIPSAHAGDALRLYAAWIEYTRKA